jgi:CTP synthase
VDRIVQVAQIPVDDTGRVPDVCVIELGGAAGDMENAPFLEALRRLRARAGKDNFLHILVTLIPIIMNREQKTKPTQAAMRDVLQTGLRPDIVRQLHSAPKSIADILRWPAVARSRWKSPP